MRRSVFFLSRHAAALRAARATVHARQQTPTRVRLIAARTTASASRCRALVACPLPPTSPDPRKRTRHRSRRRDSTLSALGSGGRGFKSPCPTKKQPQLQQRLGAPRRLPRDRRTSAPRCRVQTRLCDRSGVDGTPRTVIDAAAAPNSISEFRFTVTGIRPSNCPSMNVPFLLSRSLIETLPSKIVITAWRRETVWSVSVTGRRVTGRPRSLPHTEDSPGPHNAVRPPRTWKR